MILVRASLRIAGLALAGILFGTQGSAVECRNLTQGSNRFTICEADPTQEVLRLFLRDDQGDVLGHFSAIQSDLNPRNQTLQFAMNAGMYHDDRAPVGLYVQDGQQEMRVIPNAGPGNFGLLPNGVFCIRQGRADVIETLTFIRQKPACRHATQSGPMLVIDGALHPRFLPNSSSRYIRNGVGSSADGTRVVFAISRNPVTFHEFGSLFRDTLGLPQALYFDGKVSRLYAPQIGRDDPGFWMGPIVGVVAPRN
ncbi:phosphodiester glycosidase family protein [Thalassovita sp.]|uniref:phosphodiester glycosidase family protein n=1 Tax=Thalassovita sp. TaxID=1979401 RepID=UPI00288157B8|nr:phosphodiester glycosidase family protein [Thalassovita sp.]MDF1802384.1 phosphodiester glycosidase family protein [Thalassovita sp.]